MWIGSAALREPGGAVEHGAGEERRVLAQGVVVAQALEALPAGADDRAHHVVPDHHAGDVGAGLDHHAGGLVAQHDRIRHGDLAGREVQVGVAHPHGVHLDLHLTGLRRGIVDVLDAHVARAVADHRSHRWAPGVRRICPGRSRMEPTSDSPLEVMVVPLTSTWSMPRGAVGDQSFLVAGQVPHPAQRARVELRQVEDDHVGGRPRDQPAAVGQPVQIGELGRQLVHGVLERERSPIADPVRQQLGRHVGVAELRHVRTGVGLAEHGARLGHQIGHRPVLVVAEDHQEPGPEVIVEGGSHSTSISVQRRSRAMEATSRPRSSGWVVVSATKNLCQTTGGLTAGTCRVASARHAGSP